MNEQDNVPTLLRHLRAIASANSTYEFEFLFTDNASTDFTFNILRNEAATDERVRAIQFSRNFGFQKSILTNYLNANGDAAIQIDADLQDPPEMITQFLREWEKGYKVVYGIRRSRQEGSLISAARRSFYRILNWLSEVHIPNDAGDFRLVDRDVIEQLRKCNDQSPYIRGIISEFGYRQIGISYDRASRAQGKSKFQFWSLLRLAVDGVCSQSTRPLEIITVVGFLLCILSLVGAAFYFLWYIVILGNTPPGFTTLVILILFSIGLNGAFIGVVGEYIGRIFKNTRYVPGPIIAQKIEHLTSVQVSSSTSELPPDEARVGS